MLKFFNQYFLDENEFNSMTKDHQQSSNIYSTTQPITTSSEGWMLNPSFDIDIGNIPLYNSTLTL
jgi:hypothetical protein